MFFPLFLLTTIILSIVSVSSLTMIDQQQNTANLMASNAAFYAAESSLEESKYQFKLNKESDAFQHNTLIRSFQQEQKDLSQMSGTFISDDYEIEIIERAFSETPETLAIQTETQGFDEFRFIDVSQRNHFTELEFYYQKSDEVFNNSGILLDIIAFPRIYFDSPTSPKINFGSVRALSTTAGDFDRNIKRMMYDSHQPHDRRTTNAFDGITIGESALDSSNEFKNVISIKNLSPSDTNYIIRFQTLGKEKIQYDLRAIYDGENVPLELTNQILEVDSQTATMNMFQRVKDQQRSFAPLQPGLDFVLFSDKTISK